MKHVKAGNARLNQVINLNIFANDDLDQYNCRENTQIYSVLEFRGKKDDVENIFFQIA